jgi:hypothetical protein
MLSFPIDVLAVYVVGAAGFWLERWKRRPHFFCSDRTLEARAREHKLNSK